VSAAEAIDEIVSDALDHFDPKRFWPGHPLDGQGDGNASFYFGATGVIWALEYLSRVGATKRQFDFRASMDRLLRACTVWRCAYGTASRLSPPFQRLMYSDKRAG
jgi:hypothetical protein